MKKNQINPKIQFTLKDIDFSSINLDDRTLCFRFFHKPSDALLRSIRYYGIIDAPLVRIQESNFQILDGFRRLEAARICGMEKVSCKICEGPDNEWDLALFILSVFLSCGMPHILDQATLLSRISELFGEDRIIREILPLLGHPPSQRVLQRLVPLSKMADTLGKALLEGIINQDMALRLMALEPEARDQIGYVFLYFGYSQSKQFEILDNLLDISLRENIPLTKILKEMGWFGNNQKPSCENRVMTGEVFRRNLRERRYPVITDLERVWKNKIKSLQLPPSFSFQPPSYFEGSTYRMSFTFKNLKEFQEKVADMRALSEKDAWIQLFSK